MTTDNIIDLLILACSGLFVWALAATLVVLSERKEMKKLQKSKEDLRESMSNTNYYLRTQNHQLRMKQQKQDN